MIRVVAESMNPKESRVGDTSGLWKVVIYDYGDGFVIDKNTVGKIHKENLPYEEAQSLAYKLDDKMNSEN